MLTRSSPLFKGDRRLLDSGNNRFGIKPGHENGIGTSPGILAFAIIAIGKAVYLAVVHPNHKLRGGVNKDQEEEIVTGMGKLCHSEYSSLFLDLLK